MRILSHNQLRLAGAMAVLAAGLMLSPLSAIGGRPGRQPGQDSRQQRLYQLLIDAGRRGDALRHLLHGRRPGRHAGQGAGRRSADAALR